MPGTLKVNWGRGSSFRELRGERAAVTISKDPTGQYHVSIEFKAPVADKPKTGKAVGVDIGLESYITLSTGEKVGNPRFLADAYRRLRKEQKALSRKEKKGPNGPSNNWERQRQRVAKAYAKVADRRADFLHKLSTRLAREFDVITVETLAVKNVQKKRTCRRTAALRKRSAMPRGVSSCASLRTNASGTARRWSRSTAGFPPRSGARPAGTSEKPTPCTFGNGRVHDAVSFMIET
jgi:putative transposase